MIKHIMFIIVILVVVVVVVVVIVIILGLTSNSNSQSGLTSFRAWTLIRKQSCRSPLRGTDVSHHILEIGGPGYATIHRPTEGVR